MCLCVIRVNQQRTCKVTFSLLRLGETPIESAQVIVRARVRGPESVSQHKKGPSPREEMVPV